ncbi:MAG: radical SAM protein [Armatimonadota bacterium]
MWSQTDKRRISGKLAVLNCFDPWSSPMCTCGPKLSLDVYAGCGYECFYCYTSSYNWKYWGRDKVRPKKDVLRRLERDIRKVRSGPDPELASLADAFVAISNSSDPYPDAPQANEAELQFTRHALGALTEGGFRILLLTKSDMLARDLDVLDPTRTVIGTTVTTDSEQLAGRMEPFCPSPERRMAALAQAADAGFPTLCRIDPIIPGLNDAEDDLARLIGRASAAGVKHIVASTLKLQPSSAKRFRERFPDIAAATAPSYERSRKISGYHYLQEPIRRRCMERVRALALEAGTGFSCCREGFAELNTLRCDGRHLLPDQA